MTENGSTLHGTGLIMTDKNIETSVNEQLAQLRKIYVARMPAEFAAMEELLAGLPEKDKCRANLDQLHSRLHKLAGSGGTFGLVTLSVRARVIEQQLNEILKEAADEMDPAIITKLKMDVQALHSALDE